MKLDMASARVKVEAHLPSPKCLLMSSSLDKCLMTSIVKGKLQDQYKRVAKLLCSYSTTSAC